MLPPGYQDHPDLDLYAYIYRYDYLDRLVYKKLPGCAPSYLVYDAAHRLFSLRMAVSVMILFGHSLFMMSMGVSLWRANAATAINMFGLPVRQLF